VAKDLKGRRRAGSGNQGGYPGDVVAEQWLVECKRTDKISFRINEGTLAKIRAEAESVGKEWLLVNDLRNTRTVTLDYETFLGLLENCPGRV
jgi:hypothetical protein